MTNSILDGVNTGLYINGKWIEASDGARFDVMNPATEEVISSVASASAEDGIAAVNAAADAFPAWAARPARERAEILRTAFELLDARKEEFAKIIVLECGKTLAEAVGETTYAAEFFRWYSEEAGRAIGEFSRAPSGNNNIVSMRQPVGPALLITPWNFPAAMGTRKMAPALAAGCPVILKPASETPLTSLALAQLMEDAGVPAGVVNVMSTNRSSKVIKPMLDDPRMRKLSFTGSTEVGRILLAQAGETVVNCSMELGGNAPFVVFDDADMDIAIQSAMVAKMRNGGESCIAANRFYVQDGIADAFTRNLCEAMGELNLGSGLDEGVDMGALVNAETRDKVAELVDGAVAEGAKIEIGGHGLNRKGFFYEPTVLSGVEHGQTITREEIFGPVAPIIRFKGDDDVVAMANDTEFGLAAYVISGDVSRGLAVCEGIESGMVGLNRGFISDPAAPFGGVKQSGVGREGAHEGMLEFLETKYIAVDW